MLAGKAPTRFVCIVSEVKVVSEPNSGANVAGAVRKLLVICQATMAVPLQKIPPFRPKLLP